MHESVMNEMCIPLSILCCTRLGEPQKYATKRGLESLALSPPRRRGYRCGRRQEAALYEAAAAAAAAETTHASA